MAGERQGHVLQPTALVNEAFLRLVGLEERPVGRARSLLRDGRHDDAAGTGGLRTGRGREETRRRCRASALSGPRGSLCLGTECHRTRCALRELERIAPRRAGDRAALLGVSASGNGRRLQVSVGTVRNDWSLARAWLFRELSRH